MPIGAVGIYRRCWVLPVLLVSCWVPAGYRKTVEDTKTDKRFVATSQHRSDTCRTCPICCAIVLITVAGALVFMVIVVPWCKGWCKRSPPAPVLEQGGGGKVLLTLLTLAPHSFFPKLSRRTLQPPKATTSNLTAIYDFHQYLYHTMGIYGGPCV